MTEELVGFLKVGRILPVFQNLRILPDRRGGNPVGLYNPRVSREVDVV